MTDTAPHVGAAAPAEAGNAALVTPEAKPVEPTTPEGKPEDAAPSGDHESLASGDESPEADSETDPSEESKPKKKGGFQRKIDTLTREKYEAELRAQQYQRELEAERRKSNPDLAAEPGTEPRLEDHTTVEDFKKAYADWARRDGASQERKRTEQQKQHDEALAARAALAAREDDARRKHTDYDAVVTPIGQLLTGNPTLSQYALKSEMAPEVAYHLGKNPAVLLDMLKMDPLNAIRELTKIEARLSAPPPAKPVTKAPPPVEPVGASEKVQKTYESMSMDEYTRQRREERRKRKG